MQRFIVLTIQTFFRIAFHDTIILYFNETKIGVLFLSDLYFFAFLID